MPHFLKEVHALKRRKVVNLFTVDEPLLTAVKQLAQEGEMRKQYLGFMLGSVLFDSKLGSLGSSPDFFNKSVVNPLLQSISTCLKKNEVVGNDQGAAAVKCAIPIIDLVYRYFDQRVHQASVEHIKQIMQLLLRKLEAFVELPPTQRPSGTFVTVQVHLCLQALLKGLSLFPNCLSQAI